MCVFNLYITDVTPDILLKYLEGGLQPTMRKMVERWSQASPENRMALEQLHYVCKVRSYIDVADQVDVDTLWQRLRKQIGKDK